MSTRRWENACLPLQSLYGPVFAKDMMRSDMEVQGFLLGETFCGRVEEQTKRVAKESSLKKSEAALT